MSRKQKNERRAWNLLLAAHLMVYIIFWILALYALSTINVVSFSADYTHFIAAILLWLPVLALHVIAYVSSDRRNISPDAERQAYRDGFADAVERFADRAYDVQRLALDDEGELVESEGVKRKRSEA
jgi:hypothetical protein